MSDEQGYPSTLPGGEPSPPGQGAIEVTDGALRLVLGAAWVVASVTVAAVEAAVARSERKQMGTAGRRDEPGLLDLAVGAVFGLGFAAERALIEVASGAVRAVAPASSFFVRQPIVREPVEALVRRLAEVDELGRADRAGSEEVASAFVAEVVRGVMAEIDIDEIVERVDIDRILSRVDIDEVISSVDLDAIADRIALNRIIDRLDLDAIVARVDVNAIVDRVDIPALIEDADVGEIIRESTSTVTAEAVDSIRYQGANADRLVGRIVDRILLRRQSRDEAEPTVGDGGNNGGGSEAGP